MVINTLYGIYLQLCCSEKSRDNTSFVTSALAARSKVKGFPDRQLRQVDVLLVNIAGGPFRNELIKGVAIVCDAALHLQEAHAPKGVNASFRIKWLLHTETSTSTSTQTDKVWHSFKDQTACCSRRKLRD